jgi:hypothetical protein
MKCINVYKNNEYNQNIGLDLRFYQMQQLIRYRPHEIYI